MSKTKSGLNHSPFRYPGGKFYARKLILECMPKHQKYCEPFAGGASIFFSKHNVEFNLLNDKDDCLINCYIYIRDHVEDMIALLKGLAATKKIHSYYKNQFVPTNDLERAVRWFYLNRTSYSGIMKSVNCYWGYGDKYSMRPENWPGHLRTVSERIQDVEFTCLDFEILFPKLPYGTFLFIDPPYYNADQNKFYNCPFSKEDHIRLCSALKKYQKKFSFLLTYDNCNEVREMYSWCTSMEDKEWNYVINRTDDQKNGKKLVHGYKSERYKGKEIFIANYDVSEVAGLAMMPKITPSSDKQISLFI